MIINWRKTIFRRDDRRGGGFSKRPCKFWMEKGRWEMIFYVVDCVAGDWKKFQEERLSLTMEPDIYVTGAKLRTRACIPTLGDKDWAFWRSSCWIELRCNIYTSLKETYQEGLAGTCQESSVLSKWPTCVLLADHVWTIVTTWSESDQCDQCEIHRDLNHELCVSCCPSIVTHLESSF